MKVIVDSDRCCSSGMCAVRAPEIFGQRETDGLVQVLNAAPPAELHEVTRAAAAGCPVQAIALVEAEGAQ